MAYPFPRQGNAPPQSSAFDDYRPSSRHDLHVPSYNNPTSASSLAAPPRIASPQPPTDPFNPYPQTTFTPGGESPYKDYSHTGSQSYFDPNRSEQTFGGSSPYQEPFPKLNDAAPYSDAAAGYNNAPTPPPPRQRTLFSRLFNGEQRFAFFCWTISIIQIGIFIGELIKNAIAMKTPIEIQPTFNPLIGPSSYVLINMGARFPPCMHAIPGITDITSPIWPCLNNTANPVTDGSLCTLSDICGFGGFHGQTPDQWFRVIVPIFLHAGVIHILFNLLIQLRLGADMEKLIGTIRFMLVYFPSGIMGFILGANFAGNGVASTGCSGSLFGIIALVILDLFYNWNTYQHPKRQLAIILIQVVICFALGLLPGLDNFSHIGGFFTGLLLGVAVMRAPPRIRARIEDKRSSVYDLDAPYSSLTGRGSSTGRRPGLAGYFKGRKRWWWVWNVIRLVCLALVVIFMALLFNNFYANGGGHCSWCRYLSCLPVNGWCDLGNITTQNTTSTNPSRMMLF